MSNDDLLAAAAADRMLREFAAPRFVFSQAVAWNRIEARIDAERPRTQWSRPAFLARMPVAAGLASALFLAAVISIGVLVTGNGTAEAGFLAAVRNLSTFSVEATQDGRLTDDEAAELAKKANAVASTLEQRQGGLSDLSAEEATNTLAMLEAVERQLVDLNVNDAQVSVVLTLLERVSIRVDSVIGGRTPGVGEGRDGPSPAGSSTEPPVAEPPAPAAPGLPVPLPLPVLPLDGSLFDAVIPAEETPIGSLLPAIEITISDNDGAVQIERGAGVGVEAIAGLLLPLLSLGDRRDQEAQNAQGEQAGVAPGDNSELVEDGSASNPVGIELPIPLPAMPLPDISLEPAP